MVQAVLEIGSEYRSRFPCADRIAVSDPLALRPKDAAKALGIGQRKLWALAHHVHARGQAKRCPYKKYARIFVQLLDKWWSIRL